MDKRLINIVTLGCSKNIVDTEHISAQLAQNNFEVIFDSNDINAKIVIINTCGFIGDAKEESIDTILKFVHAKTNKHIDKLFVIGCLSERYKEELRLEIPEVDMFFGANDIEDVIKCLGGKYSKELIGERLLTTPSHYAYLKISEGCDRSCSYCIIPSIRGKHISVPIPTLIQEAKSLAAKGVKELIVIAQDTTYYGIDIYGERKLSSLLTELCRIDGIEWIRLHYAYPAQFPYDVIDVMKNEPKMCHYLDIPFQHISDNMLSVMRRNINSAQTQEFIDDIRRSIPDIAIRTTLICGHPEESEKDVDELAAFVSKNKFERLGVFSYSEEEGTFSADTMEDNIPLEEKERRSDMIMSIQQEVSLGNNNKLIGTIQKVIIDRKETGYYIGRTQYDSPEIDQEVIISTKNKLEIGNFYLVEIYKVDNYDIFAKQ